MVPSNLNLNIGHEYNGAVVSHKKLSTTPPGFARAEFPALSVA